MRTPFRARYALLPVLSVWLTVAATQAAPPNTANVAAFARLFGVVRYFYPSDAAAAVDWNRFAVDGVARALEATDAGMLRETLRRQFSPLGPGIEIDTRLPPQSAAPATTSQPLVAWRYLGPGFTDLTGSPYRAKRTTRALIPKGMIDGMFTLMQSLPAEAFRGHALRLRGQVRAASNGTSGSAALWLRVDRQSRQPGFFDNMADRPVRSQDWREYTIEGRVADDATSVWFGAMALGPVTADFDRIELAVDDGAGNWTPITIKNAGFEAPGPDGWMRSGSTSSVAVTEPTPAPEGRQFVRIAPVTPTPVTAELFDDAPPRAGGHVDFDLGLGLQARVPLVLTDNDARMQTSGSARPELPATRDAAGVPNLATRLADVVVAWNVYRHFYPYWREVGVDWDGRLLSYLNAASMAATRSEELDALRQLVADVRDGHGRVADQTRREPLGVLPFQLAMIENRVVVSASRTADAPVGSVITTIEGVPAAQRVARDMLLWSGTAQWRSVQALQGVVTGTKGSTASLTLDSGNGARAVSIQRGDGPPAAETRPEQISQLGPDVWYVDLTRARWSEVQARLGALQGAAALVFDMRGYPTDAGAAILPHLLSAPETDRWMHVPKLVGPFGETAGMLSLGWNIKPAAPHLGARVAFLTDGRAISYAESVMGYVASHHLGTIVGATTAGTNGNVASFVVPGGFVVAFTGMQVTQHDGSSHHLVGISPDVPVVPTVNGLRAGRDEVLDRAVALLRSPR